MQNLKAWCNHLRSFFLGDRRGGALASFRFLGFSTWWVQNLATSNNTIQYYSMKLNHHKNASTNSRQVPTTKKKRWVLISNILPTFRTGFMKASTCRETNNADPAGISCRILKECRNCDLFHVQTLWGGCGSNWNCFCYRIFVVFYYVHVCNSVYTCRCCKFWCLLFGLLFTCFLDCFSCMTSRFKYLVCFFAIDFLG